jgi:hypothetical protein
MRISVFFDDPSYQNWYSLLNDSVVKECIVTLDGVEQPFVQTADEELGFVDRNVLTDPNDFLSFKIDPATGNYELERVQGVVKINIVPVKTP